MSADGLLARLVAIPSVSGNEASVADALEAHLRAAGHLVSRDRNNLWFTIGGGRPRVLLVSHLDTVPPCDGWSVDPYAAQWADDRLVGLGANDAKGCVAAMAHAADELARGQARLGGTAIIAFTAEEETGGHGIAGIRGQLGDIDAAVIGEPTGLEVCTAQRGMLVLRCVARGRAAHAAHGERGVNAIHAAADDIARLTAMRFGSHAVLGEARPEVTLISGGLARNQVADRCEFFVDLRTLPGATHERTVERIRDTLGCEVHVHSSRYVPCATDPAHPLVLAALEAAGRSSGVGSRTTSDWAFLADVPAVKIGPGDTRRSHRADEYLTRAELRAAASLYARLVPLCLDRIRAASGAAL